MTPILHLTLHSIRNRAFTVGVTLLSIALSVALLLGVERLRSEARISFANTISGTDLIVGARSGPVQLLLYSVFHMGNATNNIEWQSVQALSKHPAVKWVVPLSLGDSHRGFRVLGTDSRYFEHYRYGRGLSLTFATGKPFSGLFDAVIGAEIAAQLDYKIGQPIVLAHGSGGSGLADHADKPFVLVGILERTGTPVDRTVHVSLEAIEAIHIDWQGGVRIPGMAIKAGEVDRLDLTPKSVTAALVGLNSRSSVFQVQRFVNEYGEEPLLAILRALGASPLQVFLLLAIESLLLTLSGCALGLALLYGAVAALAPWLEAQWGLSLPLALPSGREVLLLSAVTGAGLAASLFPAWRAYRMSLADGMTIRI